MLCLLTCWDGCTVYFHMCAYDCPTMLSACLHVSVSSIYAICVYLYVMIMFILLLGVLSC